MVHSWEIIDLAVAFQLRCSFTCGQMSYNQWEEPVAPDVLQSMGGASGLTSDLFKN
jgi:hypothetical protein